MDTSSEAVCKVDGHSQTRLNYIIAGRFILFPAAQAEKSNLSVSI